MYKYSIALDRNSTEHFGIRNLELCDGCFGAPLAKMPPAQVEEARQGLIRSMDRIVLYTADMPVGDYDSYAVFFRNAHLLGIENVKLSAAALADAQDAQLRAVVRIAGAFHIKVLFEFACASDIDRYLALRSEDTGVIFNANTFVEVGQDPYTAILSKAKFKDDVVFLRVCDMVKGTGCPVLPETGNAEIKECASVLLARSFDGYFSFSRYGADISVPDVMAAFTNALCNM